MCGHVHPLAQAPGVGIAAAKVQTSAEIWMPMLTEFTTPAWLRRINGHASSRSDSLEVPVESVRPDLLHHSRKFMPEDERTFNFGVPNSPIAIIVKIAAADASHRHAKQHFASARCTRVRNRFDTEIRRPVKTRGQHFGGFGLSH